MGQITCGVTSDQCPQGNCETCKVGKDWLMEQEKIIELKKQNAARAERKYKLFLNQFGEDDERTAKAFLEMSALKRDIPDTMKEGRICPGCGRRFMATTNFCAQCGKRILL